MVCADARLPGSGEQRGVHRSRVICALRLAAHKQLLRQERARGRQLAEPGIRADATAVTGRRQRVAPTTFTKIELRLA
jgi:hypothetical protein